MRVCIIATYTTDHVVGGREIHINDLAEGLVKRGHDVTILTTKHLEGPEYKCVNGVKIMYYNRMKPIVYTSDFFKDFAIFLEEIDMLEGFDIIHSQSPIGLSYAKYCKKTVPLILTSHGTPLNEIKTILNGRLSIKSFLTIPIWLKLFLLDEPTIYANADKIISVSKELGEDLVRQYKIQKERLIVIPNGIDTTKFKPMGSDVLKRDLNLTDEKLIVSVGRIDEQKGFQQLIKILPDISKKYNVKLIVVGTGPYLRNLKLMAEKSGLLDRVIFTGRVTDEDLPKYYNLADVFVFPTLREESFGIVNIEAMACEKPVITSRIGGIPTAIENGRDGILIEPGDLDELAKNILYLLDNDDVAERLGKQAREKVINEFSLDKMVEDTIKVYEALR